jgi:hypothetical protein
VLIFGKPEELEILLKAGHDPDYYSDELKNMPGPGKKMKFTFL